MPQYRNQRNLQSPEEDFKPMRTSFDISKLTSDPGYMCTEEGETVNLEESEYVCTKDDILTTAKREMLTSVLLKEIKEYFSKTLSVKEIQGNLFVSTLFILGVKSL